MKFTGSILSLSLACASALMVGGCGEKKTDESAAVTTTTPKAATSVAAPQLSASAKATVEAAPVADAGKSDSGMDSGAKPDAKKK